MRPRDTNEDTRRVRCEVLRRIGPAARVELAIEMSELVRTIAADGARERERSRRARSEKARCSR